MPDRSWLLLILFIFIDFLASALCSFSHSYITSLNEKKLEKDSDQGNKKAEKLIGVIKKRKKNLFILSCAKTVLSISLGILSSVMLYGFLADVYHDLFNLSTDRFDVLFLFLSALTVLVSFALIYFTFIISLPERLATKKAYSENSSYRELGVVNFILAATKPIALPVVWFARLFQKLFRLENIDPEEFVTEDEILSLVDIGEENGGIESAEKEMIENIFDFSEVRAGDIMTHRTALAAIDVESTDEEIIEIINETQYSRFPVYRDDIDHIIGILNAKQFYANYISKEKKPLEELLYKPYLIPESAHADRLLEEMQKRKLHMALVVDEYGGTCGIVTMEDLLEEIVGNIYDETDDPVTEQDIIKVGENLYKISGSADIYSVKELIGLDIGDDQDFDTFGGLIFSCITVIPTDGTLPVVDAYGLHIEVREMTDLRVEWALVSVIQKDDENEEGDD